MTTGPRNETRMYRINPSLARVLALGLEHELQARVQDWRGQLAEGRLDDAGVQACKALGWLTERDGRITAEMSPDPAAPSLPRRRDLAAAARASMPGARPGPSIAHRGMAAGELPGEPTFAARLEDPDPAPDDQAQADASAQAGEALARG